MGYFLRRPLVGAGLVLGLLIGPSMSKVSAGDQILSPEQQKIESERRRIEELRHWRDIVTSIDGVAESITLIQQAQAKRDEERRQMVAAALEVYERQRAEAATQQAEYQAKIDQLGARIQYKEWAISHFRASRDGMFSSTQALNAQMATWARRREHEKNQFLNFTYESRGAIASGRSLNFFLDMCGPVACALGVERERIDARLAQIEEQARIARGTGLPPTAPEPVKQEYQQLLGQLRMLDEVRATGNVAPNQLRDIEVQQGLIGEKLELNLGSDPVRDGAMPLDFPLCLRKEKKYAPYLEHIRLCKKAALDQLGRSEDGVEIDTQLELMESIDGLCRAFAAEKLAHFRAQPRPADFPRKGLELIQVERFLEELRGSASRFLEARELADVQSGQFAGGSIDELLQFMSRHAYRFRGATGISAEVTYQQLHEQMVAYYKALCQFESQLEGDQAVLADLQAREEQLFQFQLYDVARIVEAAGGSRGGGLSDLLAALGAQQVAAATGNTPQNIPQGDGQFQVGDEVKNPTFFELWVGTIVGVRGNVYQVRMDYVSGEFGSDRFEVGQTYDLLGRDIKRATGVSLGRAFSP